MVGRRAMASTETAPLSAGAIFVSVLMVLGLGYLVQTEADLPPIAIAVFGGMGIMTLFAVGLRRPEIALYVMVAYLPFSKKLAGDFGGAMTALNLTNVMLLILIAAWFMSAATNKNEPMLEKHILHVPILLLMVWCCYAYWEVGSHIGPKWLAKYLDNLKRWLDPIFIYFLFFHMVRDRARWKTIVVILMCGVGMVGLMATHEYMGVVDEMSLEQSRVGSIAGQPNILGAFFSYYMFLFISFWLQHIKRGGAWWLLVPFLLCFRGIMVTFSRGAYLSFVAGALGITFFKKKALFFLTVGGIWLIATNMWLLPPGIRYRWDSTFKDSQYLVGTYGMAELEEKVDLSSQIRLMVWQGGLQMIQDHPWVGVGITRFRNRIGEYIAYTRHIDAHNAYIVIAAEFGIPALVFFLLTLAGAFWVTFVVYRESKDHFIRATALGFLGGLSAVLMANMFGSRLNTAEASGYFWVLTALMARAYLWVRAERAADAAAARSSRVKRMKRSTLRPPAAPRRRMA